MLENCLFCKIIAGEIPSAKVYENDKIFAFRDINPIAKTHVLIVPKIHISSLEAVTSENSGIIAEIFEKIPLIAELCGLENGYRVIANCGEDGGQTVPHLHFHLVGGEKLGWGKN